jgi:hypothetical protein
VSLLRKPLPVKRLAAALVGTAFVAAPLHADSLAPLVVGGVVDVAPKNGIGNMLDDGPFIANVPNGQYRAIIEYNLASVPHGQVLSASLTGKVGPNNSLDVGVRTHRVEVYAGNGVVDLNDYSIPAYFAGEFSHASGSSTNYDLNIMPIMQQLLDTGATHLGMRISPVTSTLPFDVLYESFPVPMLNYDILPEGARTVSLVPTFDARVYKEGGPWIFTTTDNSIFTQSIPQIDYDRRGVLEYNIGDIPVGADITGAKLKIEVNGLTHSTGSYPAPPLYGYAGNGTAEMDDAFNTSRSIGVLGPVEGLGSFTVDVDHEYIESLLGSSEYFGIAILGSPNNNQLSFYSLESSGPPFFDEPATLILEYTLPASPADFDGDGAVDGGDLVAWQSAFGATADADADDDGDSDGADFLAWQRAVGGAGAATGAAGVPEPSAAALALFAASLLATGRRPA